MYLAVMDTENYSWHALGTTPERAEEALRAGWAAHMRQNPAVHLTASEALDAYGANVYRLEPGTCLRDGSRI